MPRPNAAQYAYGSATVVLSTVALLLLTRATSGIPVAAIGVLALGLGLAVAFALPARRSARPYGESAAADGLTTRVPTPRAGAGVAGHSLRR
ncbi:hypothetical protein ACF08N_10765 [Streptomyces sp. NPDC015127]|uniref:hypothetical protein n=1 Tax=Streptomyces sp. NPDC015127 TaxID=3364939 RepID=UPI0036FDB4F5